MTKFKTLQIGFVVIWLVSQSVLSVASEMITIEVAPVSEIETEEIILGEICRFHGNASSELIQKLQTIAIESAPLAGKEKHIDSDLIRIRLKQHNIDLSQIDLFVPDNAVVIRKAVEIPVEEIEQIVLSFLRKKVPWDPNKLKIEDVKVDGGVVLPKGNIEYRVIPTPKTEFLGVTTLSVVFTVNNNYEKKVWVTADISVFMQVVVTNRPLGKYKVITEEDIKTVDMDLAKLPSDVITSEEDVIGKRTTHPIDALSVLRPGLVELPFLIKRGAIVSVIADSDALKVVTLGKAKERGRKGQMIKVENLDSKKAIYARVLDSNSVLVEF